MNHLRIIRPAEGLPSTVGASIFALMNRVWPPESKAPDLAQTLSKWQAQGSIHCVVTSDDATDGTGGQVLAHSLIFRREIFTAQGPLGVGALATVCVDPQYRGNGWGVDVVRAAFEVMPELGVDVSLFQTGVPQFYEKLGGRIVRNRFYNGLNPGNPDNPFWDTLEMIYPAGFAWPDGDIDLNGEGY